MIGEGKQFYINETLEIVEFKIEGKKGVGIDNSSAYRLQEH